MYTATTTTCFDMPEGKTWDDVEHWHVKWGTLHLTFKDGTEEQITTDYIELDAIDVERPDAVGIHPCNEDDHVDWTIKIDEEDRNAELRSPEDRWQCRIDRVRRQRIRRHHARRRRGREQGTR